MISSVNASVSSSFSNSSNSYSMSDSQKEAIYDVLSEYDADSLTSDDAMSIVEAFKELGVRPNAELASVMSSAGFDAKTVGDLAGVGPSQGSSQGGEVQGNRPPPPPQADSSRISYEEELGILEEILADLLDISEDDETSTRNESEQLIDYTSRIMSLTDEAKTEVEELFEQFNTEENDYTQKEISQIITDTLTEILGDYGNYKRLSVYA